MLHTRMLGLALLVFAASPLWAQLPATPGDWAQWRGPNRDNVNPETGHLDKWPEDGPPLVWEVETVGVGYSAVAIRGGRIVTQGDLNGVEHIICLNAADGKLLWAVQPEPVAKALAVRADEEFARTDANQDGVVDEVEGLARLGWRGFNAAGKKADGDAAEIAAARLARLLAKLDQDKDGQLTYAETGQGFRDVYTNIDQKDDEADAEKLAASRSEQLFAKLDADKDGKIARQEARNSSVDRIFNRADQRDPQTRKGDNLLTKQELLDYLTRSEAGKDGVLSRDELLAYYTRNLAGKNGLLKRDDLLQIYGGYRNGQGDGPRGTPTIEDNRVYVEGGNGDLSCLDLETGKTIWHLNLSTDLGGGRPGWGYCESPLVFDNMLVVTPGGRQGTLAALDKYTGKLIWRSAATQQGAHYSSAVLANIGGVRQIVQFARSNCFGVTADEGKLLWTFSSANNGTANCSTPIVSGSLVFAASGYGTGGGLADVSKVNDKQEAEEVYFEKKMQNHHGGMVKVGDHLYGFGSGGLICMDYDSGDIAWQARSVGKGSLTCADGKLYCLGERYQVGLVEANPEKYVELGRFGIENLGRPSWAHPVVVGGRMYLRNQQRLAVYDVSAK